MTLNIALYYFFCFLIIEVFLDLLTRFPFFTVLLLLKLNLTRFTDLCLPFTDCLNFLFLTRSFLKLLLDFFSFFTTLTAADAVPPNAETVSINANSFFCFFFFFSSFLIRLLVKARHCNSRWMQRICRLMDRLQRIC